MLNFFFIKTKWQDAPILGRTVREHMLRGLGIADADIKFLGDGVVLPEGSVALTLDMPLVTREDICGLVGRMRAKNISFLRLGGENSPSRISLKAEDGGYFSNDLAFLRVEDAKSYSMVYNHLRSRIIAAHLARGVRIPFADSVAIDDAVLIEAGAEVLPFSRIEGASVIRSGATVSASYVRDSVIGAANIEMSHIVSSSVGDGATVGPFARLRGASVAAGCRIGDFVEVKASSVGEGAKAAHLTYIGDARVGARTNVGCGAVFCNYDGKSKHATEVGEDCFIGANVNLVAPLSVGDGAFIAAGTTLTDDVPPRSFSVGRARQITKT